MSPAVGHLIAAVAPRSSGGVVDDRPARRPYLSRPAAGAAAALPSATASQPSPEVDLSRQLGSPEDLTAHKEILDASATQLPVLPNLSRHGVHRLGRTRHGRDKADQGTGARRTRLATAAPRPSQRRLRNAPPLPPGLAAPVVKVGASVVS